MSTHRTVTPRTREQAALICSARACERAFYGFREDDDIDDFFGVSEVAISLAVRAMDEAWTGPLEAKAYAVTWAEAEALLRTGFVPDGWRSK